MTVIPSRVPLLELDPDLGRYLGAEDLAEAHGLLVPVVALNCDDREDVGDRLERNGAFAALVLDGMVLRRIRVADQLGMTLLGPGDLVATDGDPASMLVAEASSDALADTHLALLGRDVLLATSRWPNLVRGLQLRYSQQTDRLMAQLVICQLPRVDQRLLALMWLLAESWGRVTPSGTALPLKLTHDALGALIGARRPTVTLALRELTDRGALVRQEEGWLLLELPPGASMPDEGLRAPRLLDPRPSSWYQPPASAPVEEDGPERYVMLKERVAALRDQHSANCDQFSDHLKALANVRERCAESRHRVARDRLRRRRSRSS
jgi:CRP/FNR family transcriptional regulator, cyclic AMP receptor protein